MKNTRQTAEFDPNYIRSARRQGALRRSGRASGYVQTRAAACFGASRRRVPDRGGMRVARERARKNNTWARGTVSSGISTFSLPMRKDTAERLGCGLPHVVWRCVLPRDRIGGVNAGLAASVLSSLPSFVLCFSFCILSSCSFSCCRVH